MTLPSFSYSISRPYPYKWFSWLVIIGSICATVFFSALNLAATGYVLQVQYTTDYNGTVTKRRLTDKFPFSLLDKTSAICQSQDIPIGSQLYTDKLALPYTLIGVWQQDGDKIAPRPSLRYSNNPLKNCTLSYIEIDLEATQRAASQRAYTTWGANAKVSTHPS